MTRISKNLSALLDDMVSSHPRSTAWVTAIALVLCFWISAPGNLSETDDVYAFAYRAEAFSYTHVSDPRLMLYHMSMRGLYVATQAVLPENNPMRALPIMRFVSALCASLALWLVYQVMRQMMSVSRSVALFTAVLLGASYGFWRYAAEAEVYIPAIAAIMAMLLALHRWQQQGKGLAKMVLLGAGCGLTVLLYQPAVIPLLLVFPVLLWQHKIAAFVYGSVATLVVVAGYLWGFSLFWQEPLSVQSFQAFLAQRSEEFVVPPLSLRTVIVSLLQAGFALGHDVVSFNPLFAFETVQELVARLFPYHVIREEIFMTRELGGALVLLAVNAVVMTVSLLWVVWQRVRLGWQWQWSRPGVLLLAWLTINGAIIGRLNPAGIEAWIMLLPAVMLFLGRYIVAPIWSTRRHACLALLSSILLHNLVGGMGLVYSQDKEYHRVLARYVLTEGNEDDLVMVSGDAGLVEALRYLGKATPLHVAAGDKVAIADALVKRDLSALKAITLGRDFNGQLVAEHLKAVLEREGRVFLFERFFYGDLPSGDSPLLRLKRASVLVDQPTNDAGVYQFN